jgi:hypothetical protein
LQLHNNPNIKHLTTMKKVLFAAALVVAATSLKAQDNGAQNAIKLNPLSLVFATGNIAYERAVSENSSVQLGFFYSGVSLSGLKYSGLGITPEYRFYIAGNKQALNGVYVGPFVRYQKFTLKDKDTNDEASYSSFGGGAIIGWEKTWASGFVLDIFAGPAYNSGKFKNEADEDSFTIKGGIDGFGLRTGITLGFAF